MVPFLIFVVFVRTWQFKKHPLELDIKIQGMCNCLPDDVSPEPK